ncbi:MAG: 50S ribosomal protein L22 [Chloroflexi bacterium]|nr:50S ribosomal protein L22 [Chloroflexota bacterium]
MENIGFEVRAVEKYLRHSPQKMRLVIDVVRGKQVDEALNILRMMPKAAGATVMKAIQAATANAVENYGLNRGDLFISRIYADEGPRLRRARFGARGRYKPVRRRLSHITVWVGEQEV